MECLSKVIKLSRTECECFDDGKPTDYNEGKANIYLDELEGFPTLSGLQGAESCAEGGIWDMMAKARENAEEQFITDTLACLSLRYTPKRNPYTGIVGSIKWTNAIPYSQNMAGAKMKPTQIIGGYWTIKKFGLLFSTTATFNISVYSNEDMENPIAVYPVTSAANNLQYITLTDPLKLKMWSTEVDKIEYYFVYDLIGTYMPLNNKNCSGCGQTDSNRPYAPWVTARGMVGNNTTDLDEFTETTELNGIVLDSSFSCDSTRLICSDENPLDFEGDGIARQIAVTIRWKAAEILIEKLLASDNINRYTMLDNERLWGKRNHFRKLYDEWIAWLCENTELKNIDCLACRQNSNVIKGSILS